MFFKISSHALIGMFMGVLLTMSAASPAFSQERREPKEHPLQAEIDKILADLPPVEKLCIEAGVATRGVFPVLEISEPFVIHPGDVGRPDVEWLAVSQVLNDQEVLVKRRSEVIEDGGYVVQCGTTELLKDGSPVFIEDFVIVCDRTARYTTVLGAERTVPHLVILDPKNYAEDIERVAELQSYRTWKSGEGSFETLAKFVDFKGGNVILQKWEGEKSVIEVPMQKLSKYDQRWVQGEQIVRKEFRKLRERMKKREATK